MSTPGDVADGQLMDLEAQYQSVKADYDAKVSAALAMTSAADINASMPGILSAKQTMIGIVNQMVSLTTQLDTPDLDSKRQDLLRRLHDLQAQYNLLASSDDHLKTLQRIREREEEKFDGPFYFFGGLFALACAALVGAVMVKKSQ